MKNRLVLIDLKRICSGSVSYTYNWKIVVIGIIRKSIQTLVKLPIRLIVITIFFLTLFLHYYFIFSLFSLVITLKLLKLIEIFTHYWYGWNWCVIKNSNFYLNIEFKKITICWAFDSLFSVRIVIFVINDLSFFRSLMHKNKWLLA